MGKKICNLLIPIVGILIFISAVFLRIYPLIENNYLFIMDMGRDMVEVKKIVFDQKPTLIGPYTSLQGVFQGPIWYYLLAVPTYFFNGNPIGGVYLMFLIGISLLPLITWFFWKYFSSGTAIFALILFAFSPEAIHASTFVWNPHPMWFMIPLAVILLFLITEGKQQLLPWFGLTVGLMFHFETAFGVMFVFSLLVFFLTNNRKIFFIKYGLIAVLLFGFTFFPQVLFDLRHDFLMTRSVLSVFSGENRGLFAGNEKSTFFIQLFRNVDVMIANFKSAFPQINILPGLYTIFALLFFGYPFLRKLISDREKRLVDFGFKIIIPLWIFGLIYPFPLRSWFLVGLQSVYLIIAAALLSGFKPPKLRFYLLIVITVYYIIWGSQMFYKTYLLPVDEGGTAKVKGKLAALDFIYSDSNGQLYNQIIFTPPVLTYAYDYLIWWKNHTQGRPIPYTEKKGLVYLLIEKDPNQPWTYNGWLETVIKDGEIIDTMTLPSGFIVEKRLFP